MIIGLTGVAGSGKTTAATLLQSQGFQRTAFAAPLKNMLAAIGVPRNILNGAREQKEMPLDVLNGYSTRHALQVLGTECVRHHLGSDFWINLWLREARKHDLVVVDDVRFRDEADAVRSLGGVVYRVERAGAGDRVNPSHASEQIHLVEVDGVITNSGHLQDLAAEMDRVMALLAAAERV